MGSAKPKSKGDSDSSVVTSTDALSKLMAEGDTTPGGRSWRDVPAVNPVREQWDPLKLAHKYLDDMERGGRLHGLKKK